MFTVIHQSLHRYHTAVGLSSWLADSSPVAALHALAGTGSHEAHTQAFAMLFSWYICNILRRVPCSDVIILNLYMRYYAVFWRYLSFVISS